MHCVWIAKLDEELHPDLVASDKGRLNDVLGLKRRIVAIRVYVWHQREELPVRYLVGRR